MSVGHSVRRCEVILFVGMDIDRGGLKVQMGVMMLSKRASVGK